MRPEQPRVQPDAADSCGDEARILACCHVAVRTATTSEQELPGSFVGNLQIVIDCLAGQFAQLESDWPARFLLSDCCTIRGVSAGGDIFDLNRYDVTATQLAVDRQVEHGEVPSTTFDLEFSPGRPNVAEAMTMIVTRWIFVRSLKIRPIP